jgi:hypothetical protein
MMSTSGVEKRNQKEPLGQDDPQAKTTAPEKLSDPVPPTVPRLEPVALVSSVEAIVGGGEGEDPSPVREDGLQPVHNPSNKEFQNPVEEQVNEVRDIKKEPVVMEKEADEDPDVPEKPPDGGAAVNAGQVVNMAKHGKIRKRKKGLKKKMESQLGEDPSLPKGWITRSSRLKSDTCFGTEIKVRDPDPQEVHPIPQVLEFLPAFGKEMVDEEIEDGWEVFGHGGVQEIMTMMEPGIEEYDEDLPDGWKTETPNMSKQVLVSEMEKVVTA